MKQEHNLVRDGRKGMLITLNCEVDGLRGKEIRFAAFFYQGDDALVARPGPFRTPDGGVTVQGVDVPKFDATTFTGVQLFLPYDELNLTRKGAYKLRFFVEIQHQQDGRTQRLADSGDVFFTYDVSGPALPPPPPPPPPPPAAGPEPRLIVSRWALSHGPWDGVRPLGFLTPANPKGRSLPDVTALLKLIAAQPSPVAITLELDDGGKPLDPKKPNPIFLAAGALPSGMTLLTVEPEAGWALEKWERALPRFGKGNYYATVSIPAEKILAGMELVTEQHFIAYKANSILWEAPDFGDIVVSSELEGGTTNLGATVVAGKKTKLLTRSVGWANPLELTLREVSQGRRKDGSIRVCLEATLPNSFEPVRLLRWSAETKKVTLFGQVALPPERVSQFDVILPEDTEGLVKLSAVATPGPFARPLASIVEDGSVTLSTFHSLGATLEETLTISTKGDRDHDLDKTIADELDKAKAKSGDVQISLYWTSKNDLDLHVVCPSGEEILYSHNKSRCGGALDVDQNANLARATNSAVENVFWPTGKAPRGRYQVYVNFYGNHGKDFGDPAPFTVRIVVQGRTQTFNGSVSLKAGGKRKVLVHEFEIP